jgi:hypothetical protein
LNYTGKQTTFIRDFVLHAGIKVESNSESKEWEMGRMRPRLV